jgi:cell division protein FtsL
MKSLREWISARGSLMMPLLLIVLVIVSALAVVRVKHENRAAVTELSRLGAEQERLEMEWAQLQLEEATLSHHARIEKVAREQLGMVEPREYAVVKAKP